MKIKRWFHIDTYTGPERRQGQSRRRNDTWWRRAVSAWIVIFTLATAYVIYDLGHTRRTNCERVSKLLVGLVHENTSDIGKPGSPGYAYYKMHPDELANIRKKNAATLAALNPNKCK